jgi:predicted kinase
MFNSEDVAGFSRSASRQIDKAAAKLDERGKLGFVRRCHGDLHLANILMWRNRPVLYDAIELDEAIATVDTLYDLAFLLMDLDRHGLSTTANIVLNRYLWLSQLRENLKGLVALPLFLALRAGIRGMVTADRAVQVHEGDGQQDLDRAHRYYELALSYVAPDQARLIAVGGMPGTGKSTLSAALAPDVGSSPGAVLLRSDLERKAMAGVGEFERLPASAYTNEARKRIYVVLREKAHLVLTAGHSVVVDAVFAEEGERRDIEAVAANVGVPFRGLWLQADPETLISRVTLRHNDASDATSETVRTQLSSDSGPMSAQWTMIDASGTADQTRRRALGAVTATMQGHNPA